jgi:mono/diheme cytochrome c family protein
LLAAAILSFALRPDAADAQASEARAEAALFERHCAACHAAPTDRAPNRASLGVMSPNLILDALTSGQ